MSFHATAAGFSARSNTHSIFRNHLLCSVCAALLVMGSGAMAQEAPTGGAAEQSTGGAAEQSTGGAAEQSAGGAAEQLAGGAAEQSAGGAAEQLAGGAAEQSAGGAAEQSTGGAAEQSTGGTEQLAPEPVVDAKPPVPEQPAEAKAITVKSGEEKEFGADKILGDITVNGWAVVKGQIRNGIVNVESSDGVAGMLSLSGSRAKATGTIVVGPADQAVLAVDFGATVNEVIVNGTQSNTGDQERRGGTAKVLGVGSRIDKSTVNLGGLMMVYDQATAGTVTVNSRGKLNVEAGGKVEEVTVNGVTAGTDDELGLDHVGGTAYISGVGSRIGKGTVNLGGLMMVGNKATAGTITVNTGGKLDVFAEGVAENVLLQEGGRASTAGHIGIATIGKGGLLDVYGSGTAKEVTVNGEKAFDTNGLGGVGGFAAVSGAGSKIDKGTVNLGGWMKVYDQATAGAITVNNGGLLDIMNGGAAGTVDLDGGFAFVYDRGEITGKSTVSNGGTLLVEAEGRAGDITLTGGVSAGQKSFAIVEGTAGDITLGANSVLNGFGTVDNVWVHAGGAVAPGTTQYKFAALTATGDVTFDKGSVYSVQIANDGLRASRLEVQGQANLHGGTVKVQAEDFAGTDSKGATISQFLSKEQSEGLLSKHFVILTAEKGVIGRFDEIKPDYNYITPTLAYTDKTVSVGFDLTGAARTEKAEKLAAEQAAAQTQADRLKSEQQKLAEQAKVAADTTAAEAKAQQLAADEAKTQAEADRLNRQLHEEQIKNIVLVDAVTPNQKSTGHAVLQLGSGNRLLDTVLLSKKGDVLNYDALSGEAHAALRGTLLQDAGLVSGAANERIRAAFDGVAARPVPVITPLAYGPEDKGKQSAGEAFAAAAPAASTTALWGQAYGSWSHGASDGNAAAYDRNTGGFVTGVDSLIAETWRLGVLAGYGSTSLHGAASSTSADSYQLGVYGGTSIDALTLSLGTILAHHAIDTHRSVTFGSLAETESAGYSANTVQLFGEAAYRIDTPYAAFEPFAAAAYTHLKTDGFSETGGIAALSAPASATDLTTTTLGVRASRAFTLGNATTVTARGMAGWRHAYGDVAPQAQFAFASGGESFAVSGQPMAQDTALIEAGLAFDVGKATTIGLTYTGQFSSQAKDNAVKADLTVRF